LNNIFETYHFEEEQAGHAMGLNFDDSIIIPSPHQLVTNNADKWPSTEIMAHDLEQYINAYH
jgi:hypothetical protein